MSIIETIPRSEQKKITKVQKEKIMRNRNQN